MTTTNISRDAWLAELERLSCKNDCGFSMQQLLDMSDGRVTKERARRFLREKKSKGELIVGTRTEARLDGQRCLVPVYRWWKIKGQ
jgi:hypothetical protein